MLGTNSAEFSLPELTDCSEICIGTVFALIYCNVCYVKCTEVLLLRGLISVRGLTRLLRQGSEESNDSGASISEIARGTLVFSFFLSILLF